MRDRFALIQQLGRALMLPIAVLPVAGLLLRLGQPDLLGIPFIAAAGEAIFTNLGLVFAIGVAVGLARENNGAAGLAGVVGFLVATQGAQALVRVPPEVVAGLTGTALDAAATSYKIKAVAKIGVPAGILSGLLAGGLYNRYSELKLPEFLSFFGGRRFVPIATGFAGLGLALIFGFGWPVLEAGLDGLSRAVLSAGDVGLFLYGLLNRVLIITGLHHILNNVAWFILGDYHGATGDLKRFFAGDPTAGGFMAGYFPVMMFGLPAACLAMYRAAKPERRAAIGGMLLSMALTAFLTGVTEPIEFTFMFVAPPLYALHAVLTGLAMVVMDVLGVKLGFTFSAGLVDYIVNFGKATRPLLLLPVGAAYFAVYYAAFAFVIRRFNLKTLGREDAPVAVVSTQALAEQGRGGGFVVALGGAGNIRTVDACTTRLRLVLADNRAVDETALTALGSRGVVRPNATALQVVLGPVADQVAGEIRKALTHLPAGGAVAVAVAVEEPAPATAPAPLPDVATVLAALGGTGNVQTVEARATRLLLGVADAAGVDEGRLLSLGLRGVARVGSGRLHLLLGGPAAPLADALTHAMARG
ncbi:N-acetylglucosamine-specific PTS transporter subunit IIBC [Nitrospirillum viridazoti]|uniref:PTS N-acetyl-D-glucosamine transporter n=1 Tax=Nitrospirillum viridazoti CBAmc TaxID=1441467 RepID=A0A248JP49_9PROT|nr:N-acetylglucosamine-specific PTS transporter subunit IIBC [Nitrospirillum amazonense]ASG19838.1 PTS N-acetyl-D-glucosamine transporter [Nitrospirillum amazonense CBAmc]TWB30383.1 PTS system N-acetylglucosamine-specific IIC component [Nitrospirillum amazonense]